MLEPPQQFLTWAVLATIGGGSVGVIAVTLMFKQFGIDNLIVPAATSYLIILTLALTDGTLPGEDLTSWLTGSLLVFLNGAILFVTATGANEFGGRLAPGVFRSWLGRE